MITISCTRFVTDNRWFLRIGTKLLSYNEQFRMYITTKMKKIHCLREIVTRTTVVDFTVQMGGLEELLLKTLVGLENPGLEELKDNTIVNIEKDDRCLVELQDELLRLLDESKCSLLENEQLLLTLRSSKSKFAVIKDRLQSFLTNQTEIHVAREVLNV